MDGGGQTGTKKKAHFNSNLNSQGHAYTEEVTNMATSSVMTSCSNAEHLLRKQVKIYIINRAQTQHTMFFLLTLFFILFSLHADKLMHN